MNEQDKKQYQAEYTEAKKKGVPFFPDILFKDAVIALAVFLILIGLAYAVGIPLEARANPADTGYSPRPEWYFLPVFQLLKYFPGKLEVIGVFIFPTIGILLLLALPLLDRGPKRHFLQRPFVTGITLLVLVAGIGLGIQSVREAPPPGEAVAGDQIAALYSQNCSSCHGPRIDVAAGTDLHNIIAQGSHEGMPAWNGDLTSDQIDALAGFILSPAGSELFSDNCGACHQAVDLVASDPIELRSSLDLGLTYPPHSGQEIPDWSKSLTADERASLLNFLVAPDGERLFEVNCASCHGQAVAFGGDQAQLREIILKGGRHLDMPAWRDRLSDAQLDLLAQYVVDPASALEASALFASNCSSCHGPRVPSASDVASAKEIIASGGAHETMPIWGDVLTAEQLDALTQYALQAARGTPSEVGRELFAGNCAGCHGDFGEGGANPARAGDIIAPISSREYLGTRDDQTLRQVISQGQPDFGMSPFGTAFGGPLDDEQVNAIVAFLRTWEDNPPVETPPEVAAVTAPLSASQIFTDICARCHGPAGEGGLGPALRGGEFQSRYATDQAIFDTISEGHEATAMIAWGEILTSLQIQELVQYIRGLQPTEVPPSAGPPTFSADVAPIFKARCAACHGSMGGWDSSSYSAVMTSGERAPVIVPGDVQASLLASLLQGDPTAGMQMPPGGGLPPSEVQTILDWIAGGAPE
ncbi:MAG: c-type cytochrome [Anaerolineales bacterium]|nr:c-type cytochrome [Anaerolineales bacterium]